MPRPKLFLANLFLALLLLAAPFTAIAAAQPPDGQALARIALPDAADAVRSLAEAPLILLTVESLPQPYALALAEESGLAWLKAGGYRVEVLDPEAEGARYLMVDLAGALADRERPGQEIYNDGVRAVRRLEPGQAVQLDKGAWLLDQPLRWIERQPLRLPESVTPIAQVQQIINQVNLPRLMVYANELSGEVPATIMGQPFTIVTRYSPGNPPPQASNLASTYMAERLARLGLNVTAQTWSASRPPNVIAEKPGMDPTAGIVIIGAHLDFDFGQPDHPGARRRRQRQRLSGCAAGG